MINQAKNIDQIKGISQYDFSNDESKISLVNYKKKDN